MGRILSFEEFMKVRSDGKEHPELEGIFKYEDFKESFVAIREEAKKRAEKFGGQRPFPINKS